MSVRERRRRLLAWMRDRSPVSVREVLLEASLHDSYAQVRSDLRALRKMGRVRVAGGRPKWEVA
jgi:hypothetical protein